nr:TPM domain-containing protein [Comamonas sp. 26]
MLFAALPALAQTTIGGAGTQLQPVPELSGRVIDQTNTLSSSDVQALSEKLKTLEGETGAQVVILMVGSTAPEDIAAYSWRAASDWKLGRKDIGDGSLIVVAKNDRRMRIEVARKLEGAISDIQAGRIIDGAMKPRFRVDDYAGGLSAAIDQMSLLIRGEKLPAPAQQQSQSSSWSQSLDFLLPLLFFGFPLGIAIARALFGRVLGSLIVGGIAGAAAYFITTSMLIAGVAAFIGLLFTLLSNLSRGGGGPYISSGGGGGGGWGGGGGSSSGGGFSSGGGGSFGGGGASGDW